MFLGTMKNENEIMTYWGFLFACEEPSERPVQGLRLRRALNYKAVSTRQRLETCTRQQ